MLELLTGLFESDVAGRQLGWFLSLGWAVYLLSLVAWIVLQKREPIATLSWILALAAIPILGFVVYYLFGPRRIRRQRLKRLHARARVRDALPEMQNISTEDAASFRLAQACTGLPPTRASEVRLLVGGAAKFESLLAAVAGAQHHVHLEYYILEPDVTGSLLRDALIERCRAGVRVRLLLDAVGSAHAGQSFLAPLRDAGAEVQWFHPFLLRWIRKPRVNLRNHRKLVVIDGRIAFTGGINITDEQDERRRELAYHDLHLRLEGSVVRWLQVVFVEDWFYASRVALRDETLWPDMTQGEIPLCVLASGPDSPWESLHRVQVDTILRANHRVWLVTPYFVPTEAARQALTSAALRGVDVRVIVPRRSDSLIVTLATRSYFDELVAAGVRVFEYQPRMLHSKALLVDDDTVLVGSANFDTRSFKLNFELSVLLLDRSLAGRLEGVLNRDLEHSREVAGTRKPPFPARLAEAFARLLSPLL